MDLRDPNVIKSLIDSQRDMERGIRLSNVEQRSALGQVRGYQQQILDLAGNKLPAPLVGAVGAGLGAITSTIGEVFGMGPRQTQIQTAEDMADISARKTVRRIQRQALMEERLEATPWRNQQEYTTYKQAIRQARRPIF